MTTAELLVECKTGLGMQVDSNAFDGLLAPKVLAVTSFMRRAGVTDVMMSDDLAVAVIVMGVADLWNAGGGEIKFSPVFYTLLSQLAIGSSALVVLSSPIDGAVAVVVGTQPVLVFNSRIKGYSVRMLTYDTLIPVIITPVLDITGKILTLKPSSDLAHLTKYAIVVDTATAFSGQTLGYTVLTFTTI